MKDQQDYITAGGAMLLAAQIRQHWASLGYLVDTWIEPFVANVPKSYEREGAYKRGPTPNTSTFAVRSNMLCGWPPRVLQR